MTYVHAVTAAPVFFPHITNAAKHLLEASGLTLSVAHVHDEPPLAGWTSTDGMVSCHPVGDDLYVDADFDHQADDLAQILGLLDDHGYVPASDDPFDDEMLDDGMRMYFCLAGEKVPA